MDITSLVPDIVPQTVSVGGFNILQSLIGWLIGTLVLLILLIVYRRLKVMRPYSGFVQWWDTLYDMMYQTLKNAAGKYVWPQALNFITTLFFFVLWQNIFGLLGDMIVLVWPAGHDVFRPLTTDLIANGVLAATALIFSVWYGFVLYGFGFLKKYFPIPEGMGIVTQINHRYDYILKFLDILLWLLIGIIELIGEFGKILSLSLRLFGNMFVGMILLILLLYATQSLLHIPLLGPIVIFAYEFAVSILQAFIFALLTAVYFRLAADHFAEA